MHEQNIDVCITRLSEVRGGGEEKLLKTQAIMSMALTS